MQIEAIRKILHGLERGYPQRTACALAEVSLEDFFHEYIKDPDFRLKVEKAEAEGIIGEIDAVKAQAAGDWRAAIAFLERRQKADWGLSVKIEAAVNQARVEVMADLQQKLPRELFAQVAKCLAEDPLDTI